MSFKEQITEYILGELAPGTPDLTLDTSLIGEGVLDSTAMLQLVLWVEDTFHFPVKDTEMTPELFGTVRNLTEYVSARVGPQRELRIS